MTVSSAEETREEITPESIPAQVFLNYFFSLNYHIQSSADAMALYNVVHFLNHRPTLTEEDQDAIRKHLLYCWSTEYALRSTGELGDEQYLKHALHWTFPQAYYSVMAGLQAFLRVQGISGTHPELIRRESSRLLVKGAYPEAISFYGAGHASDSRIFNLPLSHYKPGLQLASKAVEAQAQIGQFVRTTRRLRAQSVRQRIQSDPVLALRNKQGDVLKRFSYQHWQQLTWRIGYTTVFDLMGRLRISANHREIKRFVEADIDFKLFHTSLAGVVSYLNFLHEAYVAKAVGLKTYQTWVDALPPHLRNGFVQERLDRWVAPVLQGEPPALNALPISA
ncbi:hypothetical protein SAMN05421823_10680 [Catalinimonas alkaloidigena]|uniref:Uncharacterized protein n=1 Tax=Catalinimonas alkaloidigena TaxID=1075417 RepID=A0A1G9K7V2_9BACT|nr:hypothetical protein [Catalinimonas alkaloidigena]SDL45838.1 hypothetical protein SAMN05421823_10680 [Catalinimonas alkaloidigena]